jgi:hypothetical protein
MAPPHLDVHYAWLLIQSAQLCMRHHRWHLQQYQSQQQQQACNMQQRWQPVMSTEVATSQTCTKSGRSYSKL